MSPPEALAPAWQPSRWLSPPRMWRWPLVGVLWSLDAEVSLFCFLFQTPEYSAMASLAGGLDDMKANLTSPHPC